jgi:hypothetical protein
VKQKIYHNLDVASVFISAINRIIFNIKKPEAFATEMLYIWILYC